MWLSWRLDRTCAGGAPLLPGYFIRLILARPSISFPGATRRPSGMRRGKSSSGRKNSSIPKASPQQRMLKQGLSTSSHMVTQTLASDPGTVEEDSFQVLLQAISGCKTALTAKIDTLQMDFGLMRQDMDKIRERLGRLSAAWETLRAPSENTEPLSIHYRYE